MAPVVQQLQQGLDYILEQDELMQDWELVKYTF